MINLQQNHIDFKGAGKYGLKKDISGITAIKMHNIEEPENGLQTAESKNTVANKYLFLYHKKKCRQKKNNEVLSKEMDLTDNILFLNDAQ